jgi:hypothetical protein
LDKEDAQNLELNDLDRLYDELTRLCYVIMHTQFCLELEADVGVTHANIKNLQDKIRSRMMHVRLLMIY